MMHNRTTSILIAAIPTIKHWNSVISAHKAKYLILIIKDFYLNTNLDEYEYLQLLYKLFLKELIKLYHLDKLVVDNGFTY